MLLFSGIDMVEIARIQSAVARHGERFLSRIYTARERADCANRAESLAARFAAKEAAAKALGVGFGSIAWDEIEIRSDAQGAPQLHFLGRAKTLVEERKIEIWSLSLSHTRSHAIAMVVGIGMK